MKKLQNKKTGEIGYLIAGKGSDYYTVANDNWESCGEYDSLAKLNADWEDYEEPKEYWVVDYPECGVDKLTYVHYYPEMDEFNRQIGNYFETREEAEKAVEKLKAWKRLRDKGFQFEGINMDTGNIKTGLSKGVPLDECEEFYEDMKLLFGGEE